MPKFQKLVDNLTLNQTLFRQEREPRDPYSFEEDTGPMEQIIFTTKERCVLLFNNTACSLLMLVCVVFSIIAFDFAAWCLPKDVDTAFLMLMSFCFLYFAVEQIAMTWAKPGYNVWNTMWWFDFVATIFIIPDILPLFYPEFDSASLFTGSDAGRATKVGTRAVRTVKVIRFIRILKLFNVCMNSGSQEDDRGPDTEFSIATDTVSKLEEIEKEGSRVGMMLRDKTTIKLALMILIMLFVQPYVTASITDGVVDAAFAQMASNVTLADDASTETSLAYFSKYFSANEGARECENEGQWGCDPLWDPKPQILFVQAKPGYSKSEPKCASILAELRRTEVDVICGSGATVRVADLNGACACPKDEESCAIFDIAQLTKREGRNNFLLALVIVLLLVIMALWFQQDSQHLVITPIEHMAVIINELVEDPLRMTVLSEEELNEQKQEEEREKAEALANKDSGGDSAKQLGSDNGEMKTSCLSNVYAKVCGSLQDETADYETKLIEGALVRIATLIQIGFGEAGQHIVQKVLDDRGDTSISETLSTMRGHRKDGIFGFCVIQDFDKLIDALGPDIMQLVNSVADVIHSHIKLNGGDINKNLGEAFLFTFMFHEEADYNMNVTVSESALKAVITCSEALATWQPAADISRKMATSLGHTQVKVGFGLHTGWAIEGAIGSGHKIDASYLSPHINLAARLQSATNTYGVSNLFSEDLAGLLPPTYRSSSRKLDKVALKGSATPMALFTFDGPWFERSKTRSSVGSTAVSRMQSVAGPETPRNTDDGAPGNATPGSERPSQVNVAGIEALETSMTRPVHEPGSPSLAEAPSLKDDPPPSISHPRYRKRFEEGVDRYVSGSFDEARVILNECKGVFPHDGPAQALLKFMDDFSATGEQWPGYRKANAK